jgi:23S rRNA (cytosine1962-C5)-methyltransferase
MSLEIIGTIELDKKGENLVKSGSTRVVYNNHIEKREGKLKPGDIVQVKSAKSGEVLGSGFYEGIGNLGIRILTFGEVSFDENLIVTRLKRAKSIRENLGFKDSYRWINSAADDFSGLIIDKYNDLVVLQSSSPGIDTILEKLSNLIRGIDRKITKIFVRNDIRNRKRYNLKIWNGFIGEKNDEKTKTIIKEGRAKFYVDIENGNKTGFYLDQRPNRLEFSRYAYKGAKVLDCFAYTGGFGIHALLKGANVIFVEHDNRHVELLRKNIRINEISEDYEIKNQDFWNFMRENDDKFDLIILDPPSFISSRDEKKLGEQKYYKMNLLALKKLNTNGLLISSSCSYFMDTNTLQSIILNAAKELNIKLTRVGRVRGASPCHLIDPNVPGIEYLKCYFFIKKD